MEAIRAMIWRLRYLLFCRYSPKKCFALLVLTTLTLSFIFVWNQSNAPSYPEAIIHPVENGASKPSFVVPDAFIYVLQPKNSICGESVKRDKVDVDRFTELLEARPDGEDPETPPAVIPPGVIFVPVLHEETDRRQLIRQTWGSGKWLRDNLVRVIFVCGQRKKTLVEDQAWNKEIALYGDILQVDQEDTPQIDSSLLMAASLSWIEKSCSTSIPRFVAKTSSDLYMNIPGLLAWMDGVPDGVHGSISDDKSSVNFRDQIYVIKGSQSIENILLALARIRPSDGRNFVTGALADAALVPRFASVPLTQLSSAKRNGQIANGRTATLPSAPLLSLETGCWLRQQVVLNGLSPSDFEVIWSRVNQRQSSSCSKGDGCCQDSFPIALTVLWILFLSLMFTVIHSYFWSSLTTFCDGICNAIDSGAEDEDDSPENSVTATGYESDNERITSDTYLPYYDVGTPYVSLTQTRF